MSVAALGSILTVSVRTHIILRRKNDFVVKKQATGWFEKKIVPSFFVWLKFVTISNPMRTIWQPISSSLIHSHSRMLLRTFVWVENSYRLRKKICSVRKFYNWSSFSRGIIFLVIKTNFLWQVITPFPGSHYFFSDIGGF